MRNIQKGLLGTRRRKLRLVAAAGIVLALGLGLGMTGASAATKAPTTTATSAKATTALGYSTGGDLQQYFVTQDAATLVSTAAGWHDVPSTFVNVFVPANVTRLVHATYNAETECLSASWCSLQIVAVNLTTGGVTGFNPNSGTDYAFDSPADSWEGHAVSRVTRLAGGPNGTWYSVKVQATIIGASTSSTFRLDDYMTQVETAA